MTTSRSNSSPDQCKVVLDELFQSIAWLHKYWRFYVALFGTSPDRFDVFNKRNGQIFWVLERALRHTIVLELAKLLSHHKSGGQATVSIRRAIVDLPLTPHDDRMVVLRSRLEEIQQKHIAITALRDGAIAHTDLDVVRKVRQLAGISRVQLREAVEDCVKLTNDVLDVYNRSSYGFPDHRDEDYEVKVLLKVLELGNAELDRLHEERKARWQSKYGTTVELPEDPLADEET
jgi:hypothetical protein